MQDNKERIFLLVIISILVTSVNLYSLPDALLPSVVDVRSVAMGNTSAVSSHGSATMFSNPALLGQQQAFNVQIGGRTFWGAGSVQTADVRYDIKYLPTTSLNNVSLCIPFSTDPTGVRDIVITPAVGYHRHINYAEKYEENWVYQYGTVDSEASSTGGLSTLSFAMGAQFYDIFALGFAYNFGGLTRIKSEYIESGDYDFHDYDTTHYWNTESWVLNYDFDASSTGSYFHIGAGLKPSEMLFLTISYRGPVTWGWERGYEKLSVKYAVTDLQDDPDSIIATDDHEFDMPEAFKLPGLLSAGLRVQPVDFLVIAGEFQLRPYSSMDAYDLSVDIDNGTAFRIGTEIITPVIIRAGFYYEAIPFVDYGSEKPNGLTGVTGGLGIPFLRYFVLNGCIEYAWWGQTADQAGNLYSENLFRIGSSIEFNLPM